MKTTLKQRLVIGSLAVMGFVPLIVMTIKNAQGDSALSKLKVADPPVGSQDSPPPPKEKIDYSPYPRQTFPNRVYFGDTHLHTAYSADAGMIGNTLGPEEAYRFARGEKVISSKGLPAQLGRPLDFLVVSDHAENLGLAPALAEGNPELLKTEWGKMQYDLVSKETPHQKVRLSITGAQA